MNKLRRRFLIAVGVVGGALVVGGYLLYRECDRLRLPEGVPAPPGQSWLTGWLRIGADGSVTVMVPRQEMGQGVSTALPMLVAEELDCDPAGFQWIDGSDCRQSILAFIRRARSTPGFVVVACNMTPVPRYGYRIGVPREGFYREILNTDGAAYGGSNLGNQGGVWAEPVGCHGFGHSIALTLPPLAVVFLAPA